MRLAQAEGGIDELSSASADNISPLVTPLVQREHVHTAAAVTAQQQPQPQYRGTRPSGYPHQQGQQGFHLPLPLRRVESSPGPHAADSRKRNYTNTQLGLGGGGRGGGNGNSPPQGTGNNSTNINVLGMTKQQQQQPCSTTPRVKQRTAVLKDRGITENSSPTSPSHLNSSNKGNHNNRGGGGGGRGGNVGGGGESASAAAGGRGGGRTSPSRRNKPQQSGKTDGSSGGRRTPVRDHIITGGGQKLFASPATTPVYGEPPRGSGKNNNNKYSPHSGGYSYGGRGGGGTYYGNNMMDHQKQQQQLQQQQQQSKLPHGLTVQELKEMTRARLAAEAEGGQLDDDQSIHSSGTRLSFGSGDLYGGAPSQSSEYNYHANHGGGWPYQQGRPQQQPQMHQMQAPNSHSPHYTSHPRHPSPVFDSALDTKSTDSSTIAPDYGPLHTTTAESSRYHHKTFYASPNNMNGMQFNRARCLSAGATNIVPYSFGFQQQQQQQRVVFFDSNISPSTTAASATAAAANIQRCATTSPGAIMTRLREDQQHLFTTYERGRLAIPPLSEPRMRTRAATTMMGVDCPAAASVAAPSVFMPVFDDNNNRPKLTTYDRSFSNMSGTSAMGELPSLMAEAVLDSMKGVAPIGGDVIVGPTSSSPFRPTEKEMKRGGGGGRSPFLVSSVEESPENVRSAFRLSSLLTDSSGGSMSLENVFTTDISGNRLLLGTQSWDTQNQNSNTNNQDISDDFSSMLSFAGVNGPALRGRAATEPLWFRGSDANLVSHLDPEYKFVGDQEVSSTGRGDDAGAFGYGKS